MIEYYIVGSGGFSKEVLFLSMQTLNKEHVFKGFIDLNPEYESLTCMDTKFSIIDESFFLKNIKPNKNINIYFAVGTPILLKKIIKKFESYITPNLIHPNVIRHQSVEFGKGNIITAGCIFTVDIKVGNFNVFNLNTTIGHDTIIENFNVINPGVNISGGVYVKENNLIGTNATILQYLNIGNNNIIGAASLVNKNVDDYNVMVGVPAKSIKKVNHEGI
jgi:sugar O-acyltransferase (sialic acid O-acetyltransferase NeuD family)